MHAEALLDIPGDGADKLLVRVDGESGGLKTLLGDVFCHDLDNSLIRVLQTESVDRIFEPE